MCNLEDLENGLVVIMEGTLLMEISGSRFVKMLLDLLI